MVPQQGVCKSQTQNSPNCYYFCPTLLTAFLLLYYAIHLKMRGGSRAKKIFLLVQTSYIELSLQFPKWGHFSSNQQRFSFYGPKSEAWYSKISKEWDISAVFSFIFFNFERQNWESIKKLKKNDYFYLFCSFSAASKYIFCEKYEDF